MSIASRLSKAELRVLEQYWKLGTCSVREILESLPEDERVAYTLRKRDSKLGDL
jgi:predicted transcriptional regulator